MPCAPLQQGQLGFLDVSRHRQGIVLIEQLPVCTNHPGQPVACVGFRGGPGGFNREPNVHAESLRKAIESKASADELKAKMAEVRTARQKAEGDLQKAQEDLADPFAAPGSYRVESRVGKMKQFPKKDVLQPNGNGSKASAGRLTAGRNPADPATK